jgi:GNAT superfamily N-acetyltransferase
VRFDRPGEVLLIVYSGDELVGVGGLTVEPKLPNAFRMRRFYVAPSCRGHGVGMQLAERLMGLAGSAEVLTVNAGDEEAAQFWERLGFTKTTGDGFTHVRWLSGR